MCFKRSDINYNLLFLSEKENARLVAEERELLEKRLEKKKDKEKKKKGQKSAPLTKAEVDGKLEKGEHLVPTKVGKLVDFKSCTGNNYWSTQWTKLRKICHC